MSPDRRKVPGQGRGHGAAAVVRRVRGDAGARGGRHAGGGAGGEHHGVARAAARVAMGGKVILTPPCIFHQ